MQRLAALLITFNVLPACTSQPSRVASPESLTSSPDDVGGTIAFMVDRNHGTWVDSFSNREGVTASSPDRSKRAMLVSDSTYTITLKCSDGRTLKTAQSFAKGTSISEVTLKLAAALDSQGADVVAVPEFGVFRINFLSHLQEVSAGGADGFTFESHTGRRSDFGDAGEIGLPCSASLTLAFDD